MEGQATNEEVHKGASASGARRGKTARGDSNALKRVKKSIEDSNFYEALQLIKMLTSRCLFHPSTYTCAAAQPMQSSQCINSSRYLLISPSINDDLIRKR
jgi:hypothetical protein